MLNKLLKYEFKSTSKTMIPLLLSTLALSILTSVIMTISIRNIESSIEENALSNVLMSLFATFSIFSLFAIFASAVVLTIFLFARYYKNFFADEGYLTFTLPATTGQQLTSKFISGFVWTVLGMITIIISGIIILLFGTATSGEVINKELYNVIGNILSELKDQVGTSNYILYITEIIVSFMVSCAYRLLMIYLAITLGGIIARKHKILSAVGFYILISFVISSLTSTVTSSMFISTFSVIDEDEIINAFISIPHRLLLFDIVLSAIFALAAYISNYLLLKKKLNLE
ncbi:MAG TPA: hypothetical protein DD733_00150 [Clostridiales bacterium]|nr:hypothetical protein [Eubacteriales bacterium]HBR30471.1 hypothetical protein [Clostridiales bacterium]